MSNVLIIAEAGVNHNGNLELAKQMIRVAKEAGADIVKFQTAVPELVVSAGAPKAEYQIANTGSSESQLEMTRKIHLPLEAYPILQDVCQQTGITFMSTAFDLKSLQLLNDMQVPMHKVPSGEITNLPYLKKIAQAGKPTIVSTGMATLGEIEQAINVLLANGLERSQISVLHCNTEYPTRMEDVNLKAMLSIRDAFKVQVGYSDHSVGIEIPTAAVAMGATIIEKHFTLDKSMEGPDHKASLDPTELAQMIRAVRNVEQALGTGIKQPSPSERKNIVIARRSIHLMAPLPKGHVLQADDLVMKRPGSGISPMLMDTVVGKVLRHSLEADHILTWEDME